jgi:GNAT superfamily N-acetyltransferase
VTAPARYPRELQCEARLSDGRVAAIRPIRPDDAAALRAFHEHLSQETVYRRFFSAHPHLQAKEIERFTQVDYGQRLALVVDIDGKLSAVARYDREPGTDRAEIAFVVADALQGHGAGALLLEHLAGAARRRGVACFVAQTLGTNYPMQHVFRHSGFNCVERWVDGVVEVSFPIAPTQRYLEAVIERDRHSVRACLGGLSARGRGLGLVLPSGPDAEAVLASCRSAALDVSMVLVTDELGVDVTDAVLYLGWESDCDVVAVQVAEVSRPRRFMAAAREATRRRPVLSLVAAGSAGDDVEQAGVEPARHVEQFIARGRELLADSADGAWFPPDRGRIVDLSDCHPDRARSALDEVHATAGDPGRGLAPLGPEPAREVLSAYGIACDPVTARAPGRGRLLTLEHHPQRGLMAAAGSLTTGVKPRLARFLPLTDRDGEELVAAAGFAGARAGPAVGVLLRTARLLDDQADVAKVEIVSPDSPSGGALPVIGVWTREPTAGDDDPFVRRLPSRAGR